MEVSVNAEKVFEALNSTHSDIWWFAKRTAALHITSYLIYCMCRKNTFYSRILLHVHVMYKKPKYRIDIVFVIAQSLLKCCTGGAFTHIKQ